MAENGETIQVDSFYEEVGNRNVAERVPSTPQRAKSIYLTKNGFILIFVISFFVLVTIIITPILVTSLNIEVTATNSKAKMYNKLAIALGSEQSSMASVEVVNLESEHSVCTNLALFPNPNQYTVGAVVREREGEDLPIICGGVNLKEACHIYRDSSWRTFHSLNTGRWGFTMIQINYSNILMMVAGGTTGGTNLNSTEILTEKGWKEYVPMPTAIVYHCMVSMSETSVMVIGGLQGTPSVTSTASFKFNFQDKLWTGGPALKVARNHHSCGTLRPDVESQQRDVVVAGGDGSNGYKISSVEILASGKSAWIPGPELPSLISRGLMVDDPWGGVILVGGEDVSGFPLSSLLRLKSSAASKWEQMSQKLNTPRRLHAAFLIPDDITNCQN